MRFPDRQQLGELRVVGRGFQGEENGKARRPKRAWFALRLTLNFAV